MTTSVQMRTDTQLFESYLRFGTFVHGGSIEPHWLPDGDSFWFEELGPDGRTIYRVDPTARSIGPMFDGDRLRAALTAYLGRPLAAAGIPFDGFTLDPDGRRASFQVGGRHLTLDLDTYAISEDVFPPWQTERSRHVPKLVRAALQEGEFDVYEVPSPDGLWLAGEQNYNLELRSTVDGRVEPLTQDGTEEHPWDVSTLQWSPDGSHVSVARIDYHGVPRLPTVHWLKQHEDIQWMWFPKTGDAMPQIQFYAIDVGSRRATPLDTGSERDAMLFNAGWTADGTGALLLKLGRGMKPVTLLEAGPETGQARVVLHEPVNTYIAQSNLDEPVESILTPLQDGRFIWLSGRSGWSHLYLYDRAGTLLAQLTSGEFPVLRVLTVDEDNGWVYFEANGEKRLYDTNIYRVDLQGEHFQRLTDGRGLHSVEFSPTRRFFVDTYSSPVDPPVVDLRSAAGELIETLSRADISALETLGWRAPVEVVVPAADGETPLYGILYLPVDFDPSRKYPVIEYIYGGPQVIATPHTFGAASAGGQTGGLLGGVFQRALAQLGFVVFTVDGRGTRGRSQAFHDYSYGNFGTTVIPDHVAALRNVARDRPYMDLSRVGICGLSWGGYNTLRAMLTAPETYHVGIATNPAVDLDDHYGEWAEGVMGLRQDNPQGYEEGSNLHVAGNLRGKLLLIQSTSDTNVTFSTTMKMVNALIDEGKPYDLIVLPEQTHHPLGTRQRYWVDAMVRYFVEHLKPGREE